MALLSDDQLDPPSTSGGQPVAEARTRAAEYEIAQASLPRTLVDVFAETVARHADRPALEAPDAQLTYAQLSAAALGLADRLRRSGIGPGDRVGVRIPSGTTELYVAILGILHAGAAYVPVDADDPPERARLVWEKAAVCAVLGPTLDLVSVQVPGGAARPAKAEDCCWIIFTSGSTGEPKGVAVRHRSAVAFVDAEAELWNVRPEDRVLAGLSVAFDASCEEMWLAWRNGAALVAAPRELVRAGAELGPWLAERRVTVISTVPTLAAMWDEAELAEVRLMILGGEACPEGLVARLATRREVWNTYGPTEATVVTTAARLSPDKPVTIGWPLPGWEIAVVDEQGEPVALGEPGELAIGGVGLANYLDPDLDEERFAPVPSLGPGRAYRTGDLVQETVDGLRFIGRRDGQVKLGGRRIELGEIESHLAEVPGVRAAAAALKSTAAGTQVLVGYVVGDVDPAAVRHTVRQWLPEPLVPLIVPVAALPVTTAGKVDRAALPWPPPDAPGSAAELDGLLGWLAERWQEQLGPLPIEAESDFFELGGSSLAAAKLVSQLRRRYPAVAVADVYEHRRLRELASRLEALGSADQPAAVPTPSTGRGWGLAQLAGILALLAFSAPAWVLGILALNRLDGTGVQLAWGWLVMGWLLFVTAPGRMALLLIARRTLLPRLRPGRYPRRGWLSCRIWLLDRLAERLRSETMAGTPFAARYARLCGHDVGARARLGTFPPVSSLVSIGADATVEADVDLHGWWLEGNELVVGRVEIGPGARVGARALLGPDAVVGAGAEVEPGSLVLGRVPPGERWGGSPARPIGQAGEEWPAADAPAPRRQRIWKLMYALGLAGESLLALVAAVPGLLLLLGTTGGSSPQDLAANLVAESPVIALLFVVTYAVVIALAVRALARILKPGYHPDWGAVGWGVWFSEALMNSGRTVLFSLYSSIYTRPWLRLAGIPVGRRSEISTAVGLNRFTSLREESFAADDIALLGAQARGGWLRLAPIEIGAKTFLGNGAVIGPGTRIGDGCLIGVLTSSPTKVPDGTSWMGSPPLELPRVPDPADPARTTRPPRRMVVARGLTELVRILLPATVSVLLAAAVFYALEAVGQTAGPAAMLLATPPLLLIAGVIAVLLTIAAKWLIMGRYRAGEHPLWSFFVWRDEIMNSIQDQLAGTWLLGDALGSPIMPVYLRAMGAKVGRGVWCETLTITEFDMVELGDGCTINRFATVETHLFHDRVMRIGPTSIGAGATLGPSCAVLPDTTVGDGVRVGGRSVVMRGEQLPAGTNWHGAPVVSV